MTHASAEEKLKQLAFLVQSTERERLLQTLRTDLKHSGWQNKVSIVCREAINQAGGVDHINMKDLVNAVTPKARELVPAEIKIKMLNNIQKSIEEKLNSKNKWDSIS